MKELVSVLDTELKQRRNRLEATEKELDATRDELEKYQIWFKSAQRNVCDLINAIRSFNSVAPYDFETAKKKVGYGVSERGISIIQAAVHGTEMDDVLDD